MSNWYDSETKLINKDIGYHHFPGIIGPMDMKNGGNKLNLLRWIIEILIKLNNKIEKRKQIK